VRAGIPIGDLGGGIFGAMGVLAALVQRGVTGVGQHVDAAIDGDANTGEIGGVGKDKLAV